MRNLPASLGRRQIGAMNLSQRLSRLECSTSCNRVSGDPLDLNLPASTAHAFSSAQAETVPTAFTPNFRATAGSSTQRVSPREQRKMDGGTGLTSETPPVPASIRSGPVLDKWLRPRKHKCEHQCKCYARKLSQTSSYLCWRRILVASCTSKTNECSNRRRQQAPT